VTTNGLVSVIVLNWNGKEIILACLDSLFQQTYSPFEITLVDNGSTDGSLEIIEQKYGHHLKIIRNDKNLGFSEGVNVGIRSSQGEYIALLNSDATVKENWLDELVKKIRVSGSIGMCASKIYLAGKPGILDNTGELICRDALSRARGRLQVDTEQYDASDDVLCPSGCAALYRRTMFEEIGFFDKHFFAYGDDIDVGLRGRMLGYRAAYVPQAVAYHQLSASSGLVSPLKAYYVERNRLWIAIRCFPIGHLLTSPFYTLLRYHYHFCGIFRGKGPASQFVRKFSLPRLLWIVIKVYFSTFLFLPYLVKERIKIRKKSLWKISDFENCFRRYGLSARDASLSEIA
jgi:GT2 family glycosyltransferase